MALRFSFRRVLLAVVVLAACAAPTASTGATPRQATLPWTDCGDGFQCATLDVPRDYAHPDSSGKFTLAIIRLPARD